jgi:hypothetical protein
MQLSTPWRARLPIIVGVALMCALAAAMMGVARAQTPICKEAGNLKICGDQEGGLFASPSSISLRGNITIGPKVGPAVFKLDDVSGTRASINLDRDSNAANNTALLNGGLRLIGDPTAAPLVTTPTNAPGSFKSFFELDVVAGTILKPVSKAFTDYDLGFLARSNVNGMLKTGGQVDMSGFEGNVVQKNFKVFFNAFLNLDGDENSDVLIVVAATFDDKGKLSGSIADFSVRLGGMVGVATDIVLSEDANKQPVFEAAKVHFFKVDNPEVPGLMEADTTRILTLEKLRYANKRFTLGGGTVPLPPWKFGESFSLVSQSAGLSFDATTNTTFFTVNSTLVFGKVFSAATQVPLTLKISAKKVGTAYKPIIQGGLSELNPSIGPLQLKLKQVLLVGDTAQNFFGIQAATADLQWPASLGGKTAAGLTGFRAGINKDNGLIFELAGGTIGLPEIETAVFKGTLQGTVAVVNQVATFSFQGTLAVKLPGNTGVAPTANLTLRGGANVADTCAPSQTTCLKRFELKLTAFSVKIAGFTFALANPVGTGDGGFAVNSATLTVPSGINSFTAQVNGLTVKGNGDVTVTGGGFALPPLQIAGINFVGLKGSFLKTTTSYEFKAGGTLTLPGLDPTGGPAGKKISVEVTIRANAQGGLSGLGASVSFQTTGPGIPIGSTGMELVGIGGSFDVNAGTVKIGVNIKAASKPKIIGIPLVSATAAAELQLNPFKLSANASLSVLIFNVASASVELGSGAGFNGGPGFNLKFNIDVVVVHGEVKLRVGEVTASNGTKKVRFAGSVFLGVNFHVPFCCDVNLASVLFQGGTFQDRRTGTVRETVGLLGTVDPPFVGPVSAFVDLSKSRGSGDFFDITNKDKFTLIDSLVVRQRAAQGVAGYVSRALPGDDAARLGLSASAGPQQAAIPVVITSTQTAVFGIEYRAGAPSIRLKLPDGSILTEAGANGTTQQFVRYTQTVSNPNSLSFVLKPPALGSYQLLIDNAPADYTLGTFQLNAPPALASAAATCGGAPIAGVTASCGGGGVGRATLAYSASDADSAGASVSVGYVSAPESGEPDLGDIYTLAEGLPLSGSFEWSLGEVPSGRYRLVASVLDGSNAPVRRLADAVITVDDKRAPAQPAGLKAEPLPGELTVNWTPNTEADLAGYEIGFGVVQPGVADSAGNFKYTRDIGAKDFDPAAGSTVDARLWGLTDNEEVFVGLRSYDIGGNKSEWALLRARPWALAPAAWTPTPNSEAAGGTTVEAAFAAALNAALPPDALVVRDASGQAVAGATTALLDVDEQKVVGLRFTPATRLRGGQRYTATLKAGLAAEDGRQLPADYSWSFTVASDGVYLPLVAK